VSTSAFVAWNLTAACFLCFTESQDTRVTPYDSSKKFRTRSASLEPQFALQDLRHPGNDQGDGIRCTRGPTFHYKREDGPILLLGQVRQAIGLDGRPGRGRRSVVQRRLRHARFRCRFPGRSARSSRRSSRDGLFALFAGAMATWRKSMGAVSTYMPFDSGSSAGQHFWNLGATLQSSVKNSDLNRLARTDFASEQWFALQRLHVEYDKRKAVSTRVIISCFSDKSSYFPVVQIFGTLVRYLGHPAVSR
jgi:hypothetical protein